LNNMFGMPISWASLELIVRLGPTKHIYTFSLAVLMYSRQFSGN
jgi:hypothetical protein